jgi:hypothetical protein
MKILDLGCGKNILKGVIGLDDVLLEGVDIIYNLLHCSYPFVCKE